MCFPDVVCWAQERHQKSYKGNRGFAQPSWLKQTWFDDGDIKFMRKALKESFGEFRAHMLKVGKHMHYEMGTLR